MVVIIVQEMRKNSAAKTISVKSSNSCPSLGKAFSKRSASMAITDTHTSVSYKDVIVVS